MKLPNLNRLLAARSARRAFTMMEMLVAVGIIILIMSLVIPMLGKANKTAQRTRQAADLQSITQALEAYRADMRDYPRLPPGMTSKDPNFVSGAELLCWALLAPGPAQQDGAGPNGQPANTPGMGFRTRGTTGQVYGPYLTPSKIRLINMNTGELGTSSDDGATAIADYWDHPIYYCPATPNVDPTLPVAQGGGYVIAYAGNGPRPMYDTMYFEEPGSPPRNFSTSLYQEQNASLGSQDVMALTTMQEMAGDLNHNGMVDTQGPGNPDSQQNLPFLLWSAGPNGHFGYDKTRQGALVSPHASDDVTNFTVYFTAP